MYVRKMDCNEKSVIIIYNGMQLALVSRYESGLGTVIHLSFVTYHNPAM